MRRPTRGEVPDAETGLDRALEALEARTGYKLDPDQVIPDDMTFTQWCEKLARDGLKVDGKPFTLDNRPTMRFIYDRVPSNVSDAFGAMLILQKCSQVGFTVFGMLLAIYVGLKFDPCMVGLYLPDMKLAAAISTHRFMPVMRTVPMAYERLTADTPDGRKHGEGNVMIRSMGNSRFHFLWTSGSSMTESFPLDIISFDEVQGMMVADVEKTLERLSGSAIKYVVMGSTPLWPEADINFWYIQGKQFRFHTRCDKCGHAEPLDNYFPECIQYRKELSEYAYVCRVCTAVIPDPQVGEWIADKPDAEFDSIHYHQMLSPTESPRRIIGKFNRAQDMQNFFNRVLGKPYADKSQIPISLEILNKCAAAGQAAGIKWKQRGYNTFMGIDQMGQYNVAIVKERLPDGRQATIHVEEIYSDDPFARCSELMEDYGVQICVVESLPNYNDAKRFARRHVGKVFLASYSDMPEEMIRWGDAVVSKADRKTDEDERDRYTVLLDQYKIMQVALARFTSQHCLFPDPSELTQEVIDRGQKRIIPVLRDRVFVHLQKVALVVERNDEDVRKYRRKVVKVGIDPHFAYANMLCEAAWARNNGTGMMMLPTGGNDFEEKRARAASRNMPGLPVQVVEMMESMPQGEFCGRCSAYPINRETGERPESAMCAERNLIVKARDHGCPLFIAVES